MNNNKFDIEQTIAKSDRRAHTGAWLILGGLAAEIVLAIVYSTDVNWIEHWGSVVATVLIAIGVYLELRFGGAGADARDRLQKMVEETVRKTVETTFDLSDRQWATWRRTRRRRVHDLDIVKALAGKTPPATNIPIIFLEFDGDSNRLAFEIYRGMMKAGWPVLEPVPQSAALLSLSGPMNGIDILEAPFGDDPESPGRTLKALFDDHFEGVTLSKKLVPTEGQVAILISPPGR